MDLGIKNKKALVLSGSQGIGLAIAKKLSSEGAEVAIASRAPEKAGFKTSIAADLYDPKEAERAVKEAVSKLGGLDILVINAGGPPKGTLEKLTIEDWQRGVNGLLFSALSAMQEALPIMRKQKWGRIVFVTSVAAKEPLDDLTISNTIRTGLRGLIKTVSDQVAKDGITINAVMPGYTATDNLAPYLTDTTLSKIPVGRYARPEEQAALAAFLASEQASYITGQSILADGGYTRSS